MKAFLGEYGRIIIVTLAVLAIVIYVFSRDQSGLIGQLSKARPTETVGDADDLNVLQNAADRTPPVLSVQTKKLTTGTAYNLLNTNEFHIQAKNADGERLEAAVVKIIDPDGEAVPGSPAAFTPEKRGVYEITYRASEFYLNTYEKATEIAYRFLAS